MRMLKDARECGTCFHVQVLAGTIGTCFNDIAVVQRKRFNVSICFNTTGLVIVYDYDVAIKHGVYWGWSGAEQTFGFTDGKLCEGVPRAAKVRVGCCSRPAIYATQIGKKCLLGAVQRKQDAGHQAGMRWHGPCPDILFGL